MHKRIYWSSRKVEMQNTLTFHGKDGDDLKCKIVNKIETKLATKTTSENLLLLMCNKKRN